MLSTTPFRPFSSLAERWRSAVNQLDVAGRFASDPGRDEAWWWFIIPAGMLVALIVINAAAPEFYAEWILREGYGFLELGHFVIPLAGALIALRLLMRPYVRRRRLLFWYVAIMGLGCFYIAGEEHSWGQHFFNWRTPDYWAQINRQQETNLHNISPWFNQIPRGVLEIAIVAGGLVVPAMVWARAEVPRSRGALLLPPAALIPTVVGMLFFKMNATIEKSDIGGLPVALVQRPAEVTESYIYYFLLGYMVVLARRIRELEGRP